LIAFHQVFDLILIHLVAETHSTGTRAMPFSMGKGFLRTWLARNGGCQPEASLVPSGYPWLPMGRIEPPVGFIILPEALFLGVPAQLAAEPHGDVDEDTDGVRPMSDLNRRHWLLAATHALQKIPHVVWAPVEPDFIFASFFAQDGRVRGFDFLAADKD